ncbi:MAG: undecaprenyldiphospho-muramoylpentapeptide beta-N-acetylglucosaminyltransferase [Bacteroidales bacterium]|jgi:UDP-N-acetylglucosamine--N-acetylmuramyl-(pentapeptide) pyrophosphoryl-undecaprenol N-acetylglucosamine transferase
MRENFRVIISGGGTGGHIFPAISIADAIKKLYPDSEILFVGALGKMEMERVPAAGYKIVGLPVAGLKRKLDIDNLKLPFRILKSLKMAGKIIDDFKPDAVVGVGGYASGPILWMAGQRGIPYLIQEQNSFAGLTNRILGRRAKKICVAYEGMERFFYANKILITGNPVRAGIVETTSENKDAAIEFFGLDPQKKTILVVGGSLGARTLNSCIKNWITDNIESNIQIIWQYGKFYKADITAFMEKNKRDYIKESEFIKRMDHAFAAADVVITRAGAGTISELCIAKKACIFVPSPNVTEDHQTHNAMALVNKKAALLVEDSDAEKRLMDIAVTLAEDPKRVAEMEHNISGLAYSNSAETIAKEVINLIVK